MLELLILSKTGVVWAVSDHAFAPINNTHMTISEQQINPARKIRGYALMQYQGPYFLT